MCQNHVPVVVICFQTLLECVKHVKNEILHHYQKRSLFPNSEPEMISQLPLWEKTEDKTDRRQNQQIL